MNRNGKVCRVVAYCPMVLLALCIGALIMGMGKWSPRSGERESNDCGGAPCCWNRTLIAEAARTPKPLTRLKAQSYRGKVVLWDPENRFTFSYITEQPCQVSVRQTAAGYVVESDIHPHPIPLTIQMYPDSTFYLGTLGEQDIFIFQPHPKGASLTHTTYDATGEVEYGKCGAERGYMIRACDAVD